MGNVERTPLERWLWLIGMPLLVIGLLWKNQRGMTRAEAEVGLRELAKTSIRTLEQQRTVTLKFRQPDDERWQRIRSEWGGSDLMLVATDRNDPKKLACFDLLGAAVEITQGQTRLANSVANKAPFGYATDCRQAGLRFQAELGQDVTVRLDQVMAPQGVAEDLIVLYDWKSPKELLDKADLQDSLDPYFRYVTVIAMMCLFLASGMLFLRRRAEKMQE